MPARWVETGKMGRASHEVAAATAVGDIGSVRQSSSYRDYFALLKPRVMSLVVFTGGVGLAAPQGSVDPLTAFCTLLFMAIGAGASGALNMWYDADIDAVMRRTQRRPIPRGTVPAENALVFGTVLSIFSVAALAATVNWLAAGLLAFTIFFYIFIYTAGLKRRTPQNIVIGGAAGALPPMIGWAGATGTMDLGACALFLIIFLWTPPHFWSLAIARSGDYEKVGVPMMPNVVGNHSTANQILVYSVLLAASTALPVLHGDAGLLYAVPAALLNTVLIWRAIVLWRVVDDVEKAPKAAMRLFGFSILYLFALFLALLIGAR